MNRDYVFLFDLDSTVTKEEILPTISTKINKYDEMRELTEKTMMGDLLFEESFTQRVNILKDIPVSEVAEMVSNIKVNSEVVKFLKENKEQCYIVTSNLDVWIEKLMKKIGMDGHYFCSKATIKSNKISKINSILSKKETVEKFSDQFVVAVGDGSNDRLMLSTANIGIGFGGVRQISPELIDVVDYAIYDETKLYKFLNQILGNDSCDKTVVISCAGMGKRLGRNTPKAIVSVDGKSLIRRNLDMIDSNYDVRVVVGYKYLDVIKEINSFRKDVTFVFNRDYMNNGTGASLSIAEKFSNSKIIAIDGDLIIHPNDMQSILEENEEFVGVSPKSTDDPVLVTVKENTAVGFSREHGDYEWNGVCLIYKENFVEGDKHVYQLLEPLIPLKYKVLRTKEIDTPNDFVNAEKWVKNNFIDSFTIGILGGMGTFATVAFFDRVVKSFPAEKEWDRPRIIIDNRCTMPSRVRAILYNERREELVKSLCESVSMFLNNNVDYIIFACNTSHAFIEDVYENIPEAKGKILNIIDICSNKLKMNSINDVKLYASEGTVDSKIYNKYFDRKNISISNPTSEEQYLIRNWIEAVKTNNITEEIKKSFITKINSENSAVILGCTELPILYNLFKSDIKAKVYDPLEDVINYIKEIEQ